MREGIKGHATLLRVTASKATAGPRGAAPSRCVLCCCESLIEA